MSAPAAASESEQWARGKGLAALLATLSPHYDHLLQGLATEVMPMDPSMKEVTRAYRQAMRLLHPDRQSRRVGEADVVAQLAAEAVEVLKLLTQAHADEDHWLDGVVMDPEPSSSASYSVSPMPPTGASPRAQYGTNYSDPWSSAKQTAPWKPSSASEEKTWDPSNWQAPDLKSMSASAGKKAASGAGTNGSASAAASKPAAPWRPSSASEEKTWDPSNWQAPNLKSMSAGKKAASCAGTNGFASAPASASTSSSNTPSSASAPAAASAASSASTRPAYSAPTRGSSVGIAQGTVLSGGKSASPAYGAAACAKAGSKARAKPTAASGRPSSAPFTGSSEPPIGTSGRSTGLAGGLQSFNGGASKSQASLKPKEQPASRPEPAANKSEPSGAKQEPAPFVMGASSGGGLAAGTSLRRGASSSSGLAGGLQSFNGGAAKSQAPPKKAAEGLASGTVLEGEKPKGPSMPYRSTSSGLAEGTILRKGGSAASGIADGLSSLGGGRAGQRGGIAEGTVLQEGVSSSPSGSRPSSRGWTRVLGWLSSR